jgi:hypothetical protein
MQVWFYEGEGSLTLNMDNVLNQRYKDAAPI